jgi:tetratricopeptide (TPR) repeat protein
MTRHPTARRVHRQDAAPDDAFVAGVLETSVWAKRHQRALIIGGIVVAVLVIGLVLFLNQRNNQRARAAAELSQVRTLAFSGNTPLAIRDLEQYLARYGNTPSAAEARLLLARAYLDAGQIQPAIETAQRLSRNVGSDLGVNAAMLVAAAHEMAGEHQRAEELYMRVGSDGRFLFQRQEGLDNAARIRTLRGDLAGAVQIYERVLEMTPEAAAERQFFELRLGEARSLAANPQAAVPATGATAPAAAPAPTETGAGEPADAPPAATPPEPQPPATGG